jgi:hypothetical protein
MAPPPSFCRKFLQQINRAAQAEQQVYTYIGRIAGEVGEFDSQIPFVIDCPTTL